MLREGAHYNHKYQNKNYFNYKEWLYRPYIKSLITHTGLKRGSSVLDTACGQGFFSYLFHKCGMQTYGVDISMAGICAAQSTYGSLGLKFVIGDVFSLPFSLKFDCVFTRSCSLYNSDDFVMRYNVTDTLFSYVKEGGIFVFAYYANLNPTKQSKTWRCHSLSQVKQHFSRYHNAKIFFISRLDTLLIRNYAFNSFVTKVNMYQSKSIGLGGDYICILKKS